MLLSIRNYCKDCVCHPICSMVMIGDGATDMEASPPAVSHYVFFLGPVFIHTIVLRWRWMIKTYVMVASRLTAFSDKIARCFLPVFFP